MTEVVEIFEKLSKSRLDERGRMYIPKLVRERLQIKKGDRIYIEAKDGYFIVYTVKAIERALVKQEKLTSHF